MYDMTMALRPFLLLLAAGYASSLSLYCPCHMEAGYTCPEPPSDCELRLDVCGCCQVCASLEGESCGHGHTGCALGLTCEYPTCDDTPQEVVQPDGTVLQTLNPCVWFPWEPGTCRPQAKRQAVDSIGDQLTDVISTVDGCPYGDVIIPVGSNHKVNDCMWCYCAAAGERPMCAIQDCARPPCSNPEHVPGQCCPVCNQVDLWDHLLLS